MEYINIKCIEVIQPIGTFYIGAINWLDLMEIAWADIRRIIKEEKNEVEQYFGIQRELSPNRITEIGEYVKNVDATFPSSIILAINSQSDDDKNTQNLIFNKETSEMKIRKDDKIAHIIDGQHRVFGLRKGYGELKEGRSRFQFNITIFVDMDLDDQSMVFATINKAQTKVNKSLVYDLYDFAKTRSPQRTAHNIARLLNQENDSPFKDKIKILGKADDPNKETIAQATLVEAILKYISKEPMKDRDILKRGKKLDILKDQSKLEGLFFRNLFIEENDALIAKILWNYFTSVKRRWPSAWENSILSKSTGIVALMRFLKNAYLSGTDTIGSLVPVEIFTRIFDRINLADGDFTTDNFKPGSTGQTELYRQLLAQSGLEES